MKEKIPKRENFIEKDVKFGIIFPKGKFLLKFGKKWQNFPKREIYGNKKFKRAWRIN